MLSLTCAEHEVPDQRLAARSPSRDAAISLMSDPSINDAWWWSGESTDLNDVISVLSRQESHSQCVFILASIASAYTSKIYHDIM